MSSSNNYSNGSEEEGSKQKISKYPDPMSKQKVSNCNFDTKAIHCGQEHDPSTGAINIPIHMSSTYVVPLPITGEPYMYTRTGCPAYTSLEMQISSLEDAKYGLVTASGMGAIVLSQSLLRVGDHIGSIGTCYGGTFRLLNKYFPRIGVTPHFVAADDWDALEELMAEKKIKIFFFETVINPIIKVIDVERIVQLCKKYGVISLVDNTFASVCLMKPLNHGVDIVIHSTTKYISGHSDIIGGVFLTNNDSIYEEAREYRKSIGITPSPFDCFLASRGLKTIGLRMDKTCKNAAKVANFLSTHSGVSKVYYPGLETHEAHALATKQFNGRYGGMLSIELMSDSIDAVNTFIGELKLFTCAVSLGGVESLIEHPATMTHDDTPKEARLKFGITDKMIRISIGIEDADDLIADLSNALQKIETVNK